MKNFLRVAALTICAIFMVANVSAQGTYDQATMGAKVVEMETASWGQNSPFNNLCPKVGTTPTKTGCGPTAFAILCHYYKWPISGSGSVTHNNETLDLSTHTYDYDNMLLNYSGSYTEEQATAVATLMRDLGYAAKVGYGTSATSFSENIKALKNHFSYTNSIFNPSGTGMDVLYRSDVGDESFMQQLKECLSQGYPILFTSLVDDNNPNTTDGRHIFILDGYTENNYFHFNFGWNGYGNGWYNLDNVRPDDESDYSTQQRAYLYVIPNRTKRTVTANVSPAGAGSVTVNGNANSAEVIENTYATLTATANSGYTFSHWSKGGAQVSTERTYKAAVAAEGNDYVANFLTVGNSRVNVSVTYNSNYGTVTYNGNAVQGTGITPYQNSEVTLTATPLSGYVFNGWTMTKGTNSTNYAGNELTFVATGDMSVEARFSLAVSDYTISTDNRTTSDNMPGSSSYCATWTTNDGIILSATNGSAKAYALSTSNPVLYAKATTESSTENIVGDITYTLTAPAGYIILSYSINCYSNSSTNSYSVNVTPEGGSTTNVDRNYDGTITANVNASSAKFTLSSSYTGMTAIRFSNFTVTLQKEGGASTPTPDPEPEPDPTPTTYAVTTTANPAAGGTAKFAVGTGSQNTQGDVESGTQITLYAVANTGYNFVNWTLGGNVVSADATCNVRVAQASNYVANFESNTPTEPTTSLAGKYFRLKEKSTGTYMNIYDNNTHGKETRGGVNVTTLNKNNDGQIFQFIESGTNYKLQSKTGYYITWTEWNVNADSDTNGAELIFESTANNLEYLISCTKGYFKIDDDKGTPSLGKFVYCDAAQGAAATWVLEEVVYYTVTATAGEGGSVSPLTSTIEKGKSVTLTATANEGYRFVNWTLNGNVVSTDASYTFNATAAGEYVANFEISTYTISATTNPGTAGSVTINGEAVSSKNVNENSTVTLVATPQAGYYFVNWTNGTDVVSTDATYTFTATADTNLEANFEQIVVDVVLTEIIGTNAGQTNKYRIRLDGFTNSITKETVAAKLVELYPYIALGEKSEDEVIDNGKLQINGNSYTYTNNVILPFKVSNAQNEIWHNIYWPSNTSDSDYPVYLSASDASDTNVSKVTGSYAYGDHPTYNTSNGNDKISWAIYNVNNGFEFIFKNKVTGKYIQVTSVANGDAQNVVYVENATDATVFTIEKKPAGNDYDTDAQYSLTANVGEEKGYLCSTSATGYNYATHYNSNGHQGAWFEFVESPYYEVMLNDTYAMYYYYAGVGEGRCIITDALVPIVENLGDFEKWGGLTYNTINAYAAILEEAWRWPAIKLNIKPTEGGTTSINGEENVTKKKAPIGYQLPLVATPAVGYHFVNWSDSTSTVLSENAEYTTSTSGSKNWVTNINVNFAINIYTINVTAGEGGSASASAATVEHGSEVTLTATPSTGYEFIGWYNGEELVDAANPYTFTATSNINYTARFNEVAETPSTYAIHITVASTDGTTVTNNATGNVKAIINGIGIDWATSGEFAENTSIELVASNDYDSKAYLFDGWYKNDVLVSNELEITVKVTEAATYEARFFRGCIVIGEPKSSSKGYVTKITLADGTSLGYDASNRAVVKPGTTVKINTYIEKEYEVGSWTDEGGNVVGNDKDLIIVIHNDATYTANIESAFYYLTVRANDDNYGTAEVILGTAAPATTVKVNKNMSATITATANNGYYFVNWTKGTEVVSTSATYEIAGIANVENLIDVEYVANFLPVENATAGVYYRIGYDGFAAAASAGAARAAGDVQTLTISYANGSFKTGEENGPTSIWTSSSNSPTLTLTATYEGTEHKNINKVSTTTSPLELSLNSRPYGKGSNYNETKYTIAIDDTNYKITDYSISYKSYQNGAITGAVSNQLVCTGLSNNSVSFYVTGTEQNSAVDIQNFTVTIQQVGGEGSGETPETPANRYYIQSVTCGVSGGNNLQNALKMTQETGAASIFYYADSKLLSYDKGQYIIENGGTRGLQAVGVSGTVTITTSGETATISAPNYMHANTNGTTYYADHCGSNTGTAAHANHNFVLEEVTTLPVTISSALHATFYAPVAVKIPEGVKAYVLKAEDIPGIETYAWMTSLKNGIIPANTGVIIKGAEGTYYFDIVENNDAARAEAVGNVLSGTVAKTKITEDAYILANREGKVGLYPVAKNSYLDDDTNETTVRFTNNSHKAYLPVTDDWFGEQLKEGTGFRFVYDDEETTGIDEFETELEDTIYDLQGRKLSEITEPGIYIVGGKKVWVK